MPTNLTRLCGLISNIIGQQVCTDMDVRKLLFVASAMAFACASTVIAQSKSEEPSAPYWIWSPDHTQQRVPLESCYFRKEIMLPAVTGGTMEIAADDAFEVYINGKSVGSGSSWEKFTTLDVGGVLKQGKNIVAIKVTNRNGSTAGLAARLLVNTPGDKPRVYLTNPTWRTSVSVLPMWNRPRYRDSRWVAAQNLGKYGEAEPWRTSEFNTTKPVLSSETLALNAPNNRGEDGKPENSNDTISSPSKGAMNGKTGDTDALPLTASGNPAPDTGTDSPIGPVGESATASNKDEEPQVNLPQFEITPGFRIEHVLGGDEVGSLIAMSFNEFGQILAGREGGPLLMLHDSNENGVPDQVAVCCDKVQNCQGIVCISGLVFVTADGPEGLALYRLEDTNQDGQYESLKALVRFEGKAGEHGPHGVTIGPDGMIYLVAGNYTKLKGEVSASSPYRKSYEGDLLTPRYEDPRGHAKGITAPGGIVLRCRQDGSGLETFAGGLRNCYDLTFHASGDLFTHDSDMETDEGTPWQRATRFIHVPSGGEHGWRSGWSNWPEYWIDGVPSVLGTERGSPTGLVSYDHRNFPDTYRNAVFSCDWAQGQINVIRVSAQGAGYGAKFEPFLRGKPLNVTDVGVGPDGWLYFVTGGRGTAGHIFRVVWEGEDGKEVPEKLSEPTNVVEAIAYPQFDSAWSRQTISTLRQKMGVQWEREIQRFVKDPSQPGEARARAMEMMHLLGPPPTDRQLIDLSRDQDPVVKARAAYYLGLIGNDPATERLTEMLSDSAPTVRRACCEALARKGKPIAWDQLVPLLRSNDRLETWAARRLLECNQRDAWLDQALAEQTPSAFLHGATAWLIASPEPEGARRILQRIAELAAGFVNDADFGDMLRVMQLALIRGPVSPEEAKQATSWLDAEFPAGNPLLTREIASLLVYVQSETVTQRMLDYLEGDAAQEDKIHVATRMRYLQHGWTSQQRIRLIQLLEQARGWSGGTNLPGYLEQVQTDYVKTLPVEDLGALLSQGESVPRAALAALFAMPEKVDDPTIEQLADLYARLPISTDEAYQKLRVGIVAVLGSKASDISMEYLRAIYDTDPERRQAVAIALAQVPDGRNWDYLVRSIGILEGDAAREVLKQLQTVPYAPESPEYFRQVILIGLRYGDDLGADADALLNHWTQRSTVTPEIPLAQRFTDWQEWFAKQYPDQQPATLQEESHRATWTMDDLVTYLESAAGQAGSIEHGAVLFKQAQCADCHRFDKIGKSIGPDLTSVTHRFQRKEILESILHPSQVISDQYASHSIALKNGTTMNGLLVPDVNGKVVVVQSSGTLTTVNELDIDEISPSQVSSMPEGLLNTLSLDDIRDLFAFLNSGPPMKESPGAVAEKETQKRR